MTKIPLTLPNNNAVVVPLGVKHLRHDIEWFGKCFHLSFFTGLLVWEILITMATSQPNVHIGEEKSCKFLKIYFLPIRSIAPFQPLGAW